MIVREKIIAGRCIFLCLFFLVISAPAIANEPNSEEDPFLVFPQDRTSAELPTPYGFIVDIAYPAAFIVLENNTDGNAAVPFEFIYYLDAWQFSLSSKEYGNTARVLFRKNIERDVYDGIFIEMGYGWEAELSKYDDDKGEYVDYKDSPFLIGIGLKYQNGFDKETSFSYFSEWILGYGSMEDVDPFLYGQGELGIGARIPISTMSAYIQGGVQYGFAPHRNFYRTDSYYGIIVKFTYSLNYNN